MRRTGISPVIATVILVAVAIAVAVAVAFWMTGIVGLFTGRVEQLEVVSATATFDETANAYKIKVIVRNAGTAPVTIDGVFITPSELGDGATCTCTGATTPPAINDVATDSDCKIDPGDSATIEVTLSGGTAGQSVEVKIHTAGGKEYPKLVVLP